MINRRTSGTAMNDNSSRSHLIVTVTIEIYNKHTNQVIYEFFVKVLKFIFREVSENYHLWI